MLTIPQRQMCSSMAAACRVWRDRMDQFEQEIDEIIWEAFGDDAEGGRTGIRPLIAELALIAHEVGDYPKLKEADSKFGLLKKQLLEYWRRYPNAKVVLFAYFRGTLHYLRERFAELGVRSALLMGGMDKDAILGEFASPAGPRLLLSSEVASEGVDLQFSALVINYDLPWNPMRIEQRIGRIDRIGQKADRILIWNIFLGDTLDDRVYTRLFQRLNIFEEALGATEGVLGDQVRAMSYELLRHHLSPEEEDEVIEQTRLAMEKNARLQDELEDQASRLVAHGDYLQMKINSARQLNRYVSAEDLLVYVRDFVEGKYEGAQFVPTGDGQLMYEVDLGPAGRADFATFLEQERLQGRTRLAAPGSGRQRCRFENRLGRSDPSIEVISQYHPLVAWVSRRLRSEDAARHAPIAALQVEGAHLPSFSPGRFVFAVQRWTVMGERVIERLAFSALRLTDDADGSVLAPEEAELLITTAALKGSDWIQARGVLDGERVHDLFGEAVDVLESRYSSFVTNAEIENRDRINFQIQVLDRHERNTVEALQSLIAQLRQQGKKKTIRANEGRIRKARERAEDRRARLRARLLMKHEYRLVAGGVIEVI
jgi:hypothetical protein